MPLEKIEKTIAEHTNVYIEWLRSLCAIQGVSAQEKNIDESVEEVTKLIEAVGGKARVLEIEGANPAVYAEFAGKSDRTLLFYNHYDVQPAEPYDEWHDPPFSGVIRSGAFYARGAADNKGDLISRLAAVHAWKTTYGTLPCHVKFLIEGEEEIGSPHLSQYLQQYAPLLESDVCIWKYGSRDPAERLEVGLGLKGILYVELLVDIASSDLHSGYGSLVEAASNRLIRALASLRDGRGQVLIPGFYDDIRPPTQHIRTTLESIPFDDSVLRERYGIQRFLRDRIRTGALATLILEPTCTVCGIESGYISEGMRTVLPRQAKAKVEFRLVPDQTPERVLEQLKRHLVMKGFPDIQVKPLAAKQPFQTPTDHPFVQQVVSVAKQVTGREIVIYPNSQYSGPMHDLAAWLEVPIVSIGVGYWDRRSHAPNEHIRLHDFTETITLMSHLFQAVGEDAL